MLNWIRSRFRAFVGNISQLAGLTGDGLSWLWSIFVQLWTMVKTVQGYLAMVANGFRDMIWNFFKATYTAIRHVLLITIPQFAEVVWKRAVEFVTAAVNDAKTFLHGLITTLENWARDALNALTAFAHGIVTWATSLFRDIINTLTHVAERVAQLLTDPAAFSTWVIGALWGVAWQFAFAHREAIASWVLRRAIGVTTAGASVAEEVITRVL